jgi:antitoxin ParD1/3/4
MNVSLTPELEKFVHDKVASGLYLSASEVVRDGLRLLAEQDQLREIKLEALRQEIRKGLESGPGAPWDVEDLKRKLHVRLAAQGSS